MTVFYLFLIQIAIFGKIVRFWIRTIQFLHFRKILFSHWIFSSATGLLNTKLIQENTDGEKSDFENRLKIFECDLEIIQKGQEPSVFSQDSLFDWAQQNLSSRKIF